MKVKKTEEPLAITTGSASKVTPALPAPPIETFMTSANISQIHRTDEDLTDEALMRQYEELSAKDPNFGKKGKRSGF